MKGPIRSAVVVGCGSIARRHAAKLQRLGVKRIVAVDPDAERLEHMRRELGCEAAASLASALDEGPGAVLICTPPSAHAAAALAAVERRIPCFVEKPAADTAAAAAKLMKAASRRRVPLAIGYQLRFHPAIAWIRRGLDERRWGPVQYVRAQVGQYLPDWRPWQDYRKSYTARRALGGGILLDASHEIDLALHLAGPAKSVTCAAARLSALDVDVEDTAEMILRFRGGAMGSVHLDMIRRAYDRSSQLLCRDGVVEWSYQDGTVREYSAKTKKWTKHSFTKDANAMYLSELAAFLAYARGGAAGALATPADGLAALRVVEAAKSSSAAGRTRPL